MASAVNWFEIPVSDFKRAKDFYEKILDCTMYEMQMGKNMMAFFPMGEENTDIGGSLISGEGHEPCDKGSLIYLNANPDLEAVTNRIEQAGGKLITPKMLVREDIGYIALFMDTEGNRVALHSRN